MNREQLLEKMDGGRAELEKLLKGLPEEEFLAPTLPNGWSVKDLLAHLETWAVWAEALYPTLAAGKTPEKIGDVDETNARIFAENRERPLREVLRAEEDAFRRLRALAETAPEADLFDPLRFAWCGGQPFVNYIAWNSYDHYAEHIPDLASWRNARKGNRP
uniref:ClbS/DfsB family four-helix bundle protein n=1 Tax=Anaerolinea thermolimosa TaxID=229919 RepID=A0A7C4PJI6_9CHLR